MTTYEFKLDSHTTDLLNMESIDRLFYEYERLGIAYPIEDGKITSVILEDMRD